jgi:hypothetical protein
MATPELFAASTLTSDPEFWLDAGLLSQQPNGPATMYGLIRYLLAVGIEAEDCVRAVDYYVTRPGIVFDSETGRVSHYRNYPLN